MVCQGTYSIAVPPLSGNCVTECAGCQWTFSVNMSDGETGCEYSYTVTRTGGTQGTQQWIDAGALSCGSRLVKEFHCDAGESCVGRRLTLLCSKDE